jgi:hypothetical protein
VCLIRRLFIILYLELSFYNCGAKKTIVGSRISAESTTANELDVFEEELLGKYVNNDFENHRDVHSSTLFFIYNRFWKRLRRSRYWVFRINDNTLNIS